ncbi:hypothetical protein TNCV_1867981 [Trichonephila clavipes]|nr:hypothetical protein TNCV_1867981 [Trichonephila clavipes]
MERVRQSLVRSLRELCCLRTWIAPENSTENFIKKIKFQDLSFANDPTNNKGGQLRESYWRHISNENKIDRERQRAGASAQNEWQRGTEANMRKKPKTGERRATYLWYWDRTHDMPAMVGYLNHWATAALRTRRRRVMSLSLVPLKNRHVGLGMHAKSSEA